MQCPKKGTHVCGNTQYDCPGWAIYHYGDDIDAPRAAEFHDNCDAYPCPGDPMTVIEHINGCVDCQADLGKQLVDAFLKHKTARFKLLPLER